MVLIISSRLTSRERRNSLAFRYSAAKARTDTLSNHRAAPSPLPSFRWSSSISRANVSRVTFSSTWASPNDGDGKENPFNPADEIPAAARYDCALAQQTSKVPGDAIGNMLAAYNAGPGAVLSANGIPDITQTQDYVKNIESLEKAFAAPTTTTISASSVAVQAIKFAYERLGTPYLYGGTGTAAEDGEFDCSGLTQAAYASAGVTLPRVAAEQWYAGVHIPESQLEPGDLVFFATNVNDPSTIEHVGIYVGGGAMIDAPHTGSVIRFDSISGFNPTYIGAVRPYSTVPSWPVATGLATPSVTASASAN